MFVATSSFVDSNEDHKEDLTTSHRGRLDSPAFFMAQRPYPRQGSLASNPGAASLSKAAPHQHVVNAACFSTEQVNRLALAYRDQ